MYEIVFSRTFRKELKKTIKHHPGLWKRIRKTLNLLNTNIKHRSLKLHKLSGIDYWSVSVADSYRIKIRFEDRYIICIKFGKHEDVY